MTVVPDASVWILAMICPIVLWAIGFGLWWSGTHRRVGLTMMIVALLTACGVGAAFVMAYYAAMKFRGGTGL